MPNELDMIDSVAILPFAAANRSADAGESVKVMTVSESEARD